jgi:transposase-like protein
VATTFASGIDGNADHRTGTWTFDMSNRRFSDAEIQSKITLFHSFRADGMRVYEITRRLGITDTTLYAWLRKHDAASFEKSQIARLKRENARLRRLVAALPETKQPVSVFKTSPPTPVSSHL